MHVILACLCLLVGSYCMAGPKIPSLEEVIQAQKRCSPSEWKKLQLHRDDEDNSFVTLNPSHVLFAETFSVKELPSDKPTARKFKIAFESWGQFFCTSFPVDSAPPRKPHVVEGIYEIKENVGKADFLLRDLTEYITAYPASGIYRDGADDGSNGFVCIVDPSEYVKNPNLINIQKLCEGHSAAEKKSTEKLMSKYLDRFKGVFSAK